MSCTYPHLMLLSLEEPGKRGLISRELRLFSCACVRQLGELIESEKSWLAVDVGERYADGDASEDDLRAAHHGAELAVQLIRQRIKKLNSQTRAIGGVQAAEEWRLFDIDDWHPDRRRENAAKAAGLCARQLILSSNINPEVKCCGDWHLAKAASMYAYSASAGREALEARESRRVAQDDGYLIYEDRWQADLVRCILGDCFRRGSTDNSEIEFSTRAMAESIYRLRDFDRMSELGKELIARQFLNLELVAHCTHDRVHARGCWALDVARGLNRAATKQRGHS